MIEETGSTVRTPPPAPEPSGRRYWRSLEELEEPGALDELVRREFPQGAELWTDEIGRRNFLKLMAASLGLWGWTGCTKQPEEKIVPYVVPPEQVIPGKPLTFASAISLGGYGRGVLVESHQGRPTKIEGNPDHPASLGAADAMTQASVLGLWDPDRAQVVSQGGSISTWGGFLSAWSAQAPRLRESGGRGLRLLTETVTSPTLLSQIQALLRLYPEAKWHHWDPLAQDNARRGARLAFGRTANAVLRLERAERILSLDSDFLSEEPGSPRYAREFSDGRRVRSPVDREGRRVGPGRLSMNRLYMVQSTPTITGAMADHRLTVRASEVEGIARTIAGRLKPGAAPGAPAAGSTARWFDAVAEDLKQHAGASLVVAGPNQPPVVHALAHAMNAALGNVGKTVIYTEPPDPHPAEAGDSIAELAQDLRAGSVEVLVMLGANPVYSAPADLNFREALETTPRRIRQSLYIHQSLYYDETSYYCHWHIPETHYLESWSDVRAFDGTASIVQPLIAPLYQGKSAHQLLSALLGQSELEMAGPVRAYWRESLPGVDFERFWEDALRKGVVPDTAFRPIDLKVEEGFLAKAAGPAPEGASPEAIEILFRPDPCVGDGRFANNGWLQELPKPLTKLTWDNAALLSPATARKLGVEKEDVVKLRSGGREVEAAVWVLPGHPDGAVTVHLGYGRERAGRVGTRTEECGGFDAYRLRTSRAPWFERGLEVVKTGRRRRLACTQTHQLLEGPTRDLFPVMEIGAFAREVGEGRAPQAKEEPTLHRDFDYSAGHRWAMQIDNNSCIGCNACVVACQAENNVPIVGKSQVLNAREMHWIRIDTFFEGDPEADPAAHFEPIPCMQCERAPCEPVCPVGATTHSVEGLNEMTYNRCVGTRYCSNNCPYKVRRFNFLQYADVETPSLQLGRNPDVTVRTRGVMEKCTYCVQRINHARIDLKKLELERSLAATPEEQARLRRSVDERMGKLEPACAQTCPTRAIVFGDLNWKFQTGGGPEESPVKKLQDQPQDFALLPELNTRPRTRYLPRFLNPNPEIGGDGGRGSPGKPVTGERH